MNSINRMKRLRSKIRAEQKKRNLAVTWKNPRFYLMLIVFYPIAFVLAISTFPFRLLIGLLQAGLDLFDDLWGRVAIPVRDWVLAGPKLNKN